MIRGDAVDWTIGGAFFVIALGGGVAIVVGAAKPAPAMTHEQCAKLCAPRAVERFATTGGMVECSCERSGKP